ncbi:unnamed protein product [Ambrosiozyma monospora]|uniref:Unnamed protein product n=1 Tax=Ambrosiozyma monospora TaxID=43982 RepID=A0ACB5SUX8_AMBMO|nr:unnamed protein product [Ambrosiozyma monospora]
MSFFKPKKSLEKTKSDDPFTATQTLESSLYIDDEDPSDDFYLKGSSLKTKLDNYNQLISKIRDQAIKLDTLDNTVFRSDLTYTFKELESLQTSIRFDFSTLSKSLDLTSLKKVNYYNDLVKLLSQHIPSAKSTFQLYRVNYLQYLQSNYGAHPHGNDFELYIRNLSDDGQYSEELKKQRTDPERDIVTHLRSASLEISAIESFFESLNIIESELVQKKYEGEMDATRGMNVNQSSKYGAVPSGATNPNDGYLSSQQKKRNKRKRLIIVLCLMFLILLGVGLGAGLGVTQSHKSHDDDNDKDSSDSSNKSVSKSTDSDDSSSSSSGAYFANPYKSSKSSSSSNSNKATFVNPYLNGGKSAKGAKSHKSTTTSSSSSKGVVFAKPSLNKSKSSSSGKSATFGKNVFNGSMKEATANQGKAKSKNNGSTSSGKLAMNKAVFNKANTMNKARQANQRKKNLVPVNN